MRSLVLFIIGGALLVIALATGCKSEGPAAKAGDPETAASGAASGQPDDSTPALPVPRRMRSGQSDNADPAARPAWREQRGEEMRQRMAEMRQRFDANHDGQLDEGERDAMRHARIQDRVARIDSDSDGVISRQEAEAAPRMLRDFDAVDANQDSRISPDELEAAMSERQARRRERRQEDAESADAPDTSPAD